MIQILRLLHILSGAFWYGTVIFAARFLMPALRAAGPGAAGAVSSLLTLAVAAMAVGRYL